MVRVQSRAVAALVLAATLTAALGAVAGAQGPIGESPLELAGRWVRIPNAPWGSAFPAYGEVDGKMLVVDRETGRVQTYDPDTRRWKRGTRAQERMGVPNSPWVWTGDELIIFDANRSGHNQAYDPQVDAWRVLAPSPLPGHDRAIWADGQILAAHLDDEDGPEVRTMAVYDLATDAWTTIEPAPGADWLEGLFWTGAEVLAVTSGQESGPVQVSAYEPATGTWGEPVVGPVSGRSPLAIWAGDRLVFSAELTNPALDFVVDATYDPATKTWELRDYDCPSHLSDAMWTGELILGAGTTGRSIVALDPASGRCYGTPTPSFKRTRIANPALWLGDRAIYWTGSSEERVPYKRNGAALVIEDGTQSE